MGKWTRELKYDAAGCIGAGLQLVWLTTLRWEGLPLLHANLRKIHREHGEIIFAFWHGQLLMPAYLGREMGVRILISQSEDGEYIARMVKRLGFRVVRGSATRGGSAALRELVGASAGGDLAVTPDGPLGPRHKVQPGTILLAQLTGRPIVPIAGAWRWGVRVRSWDRFEIPLPGSRAAFCLGEPMHVDTSVKGQDRQVLCAELRERLIELTNRARRKVGLPAEND